MAILDFLKKQFIDIIQWTDDSRDTLSYRFPDDDQEIKNGAQLIVRESQVAQFIYLGEYGDTFKPGKHTLTTDNIPVLTNLKSWKYALESPFKADVYYVVTRTFPGNKWGTANPVMMRDADFGVVRLRAYGTYDFKIVEPRLFLKEVAGTDNHFRLDEFADVMRSRIVSVFSEALSQAKVPVLDVASRYSEMGDAMLPLINAITSAKYGIEITSFVCENVSVPPEVEKAIDARGAMTTIGDMGEYVRYQMGTATGEGRAGGLGIGAEFATAMALGQQMIHQPGGPVGTNPNAPKGMIPQAQKAGETAPQVLASAAVAAVPVLHSPADVAKLLGVGEADVISVLESGELKGKKIGTQWRVTQAAVDAYLNA